MNDETVIKTLNRICAKTLLTTDDCLWLCAVFGAMSIYGIGVKDVPNMLNNQYPQFVFEAGLQVPELLWEVKEEAL